MSGAEQKAKFLSYKIPRIAVTAMALANANHKANQQEILEQVLEVLMLDPNEKWHVNFDTGFITREAASD